MGITALSYFIGYVSYRKELVRRIETTDLNTDFVQQLRRTLKVNKVQSEFNVEDSYSKDSAWGNATTSYDTSSTAQDFGASSSNQPQPFGQPYRDGLALDTDLAGQQPKQPVSYEELRARNRGMIR